MGGFLTFRDLSHPSWGSGEVVHTLTDSAQLFIFVLSPQQNSLVGWSNNSEAVLGLKDYEVARDGNVFLRHAHSDDRYQLLNTLEELFKRNGSIRHIYRWIRPDTAELRWLLCRAEPASRDEGIVYEGIIADVTTELQQRQGEPRPDHALFDALGLWAAILDSDGRVVMLHSPPELAEFTLGDPGFIRDHLSCGKSLLEGFSSAPPAQEIKELLGAVISGRTPQGSARVRWKAHTFLLHARVLGGSPATGTLVTIRDTTELDELMSAAASRERAENFVQLSSGILHQVNNSLQRLLGHAAAISTNLQNPEALSAACSAISHTIEEAAALTQQALTYKDSLTEAKGPMDLNTAVMNALNRLQDLLSHGTKIAVSLGNLPPIRANQSTVVNAIETLLRTIHELCGANRSLSVHTSTAELSHRPASQSVAVCLLTITANLSSAEQHRSVGAVSPDHLAIESCLQRLAQSWSSLGAHFTLRRSKAGIETITIRFPVASADSCELRTSSVKHEDRIRPTQQSPEVLIVDDDLMILQTLAKALEDAGFRSITSSNRRSALQIFKRYSHCLRLVILDALLPSTHGSALLRSLKRINPAVTVLGFSGASTPDTDALLAAGAAQVLRKPMHPERLLQAVRELLGKQDAA